MESFIGLVLSLQTSCCQFVPQMPLVHILPDVLTGVHTLGHQASVHGDLEKLHHGEGQFVSLHSAGGVADGLPGGDVGGEGAVSSLSSFRDFLSSFAASSNSALYL